MGGSTLGPMYVCLYVCIYIHDRNQIGKKDRRKEKKKVYLDAGLKNKGGAIAFVSLSQACPLQGLLKHKQHP